MMDRSGKTAIVIGAGFGGMAAALRMRALGHDVTLIERQNDLGGRARVFRREGFVFDAGPTVITAPYLFEELFSLFGKSLADYVDMIPLDLWYRFIFSDGTSLDYSHAERTQESIAKLSPADAQNYQHFLQHSRKIFSMAYEDLAAAPMSDLWMTMKRVPQMMKLGCFQSVYAQACKYFDDPRLQQAFSIQPLLLGGNPLDTTSIYLLIHALEQKWGVHFPKGGTGALVSGLEKLMKEEGIRIITGASVTGFIHAPKTKRTESKRIAGVKLDTGESLHADHFISNIDPDLLYEMLEDKQTLPAGKLGGVQHSFGLFVWYFGTRKTYAHVPHHTILFGKDYERQLRHLFRGSDLPADDFSIYLHRPTATDPDMAPEGCDSFYALVPVPNLERAPLDWETGKQTMRNLVMNALQERLLPDLENSIVTDFSVDPRYFKNDLLSKYGSGFSIAPLFYQSGYFRYHNKSPTYNNLYLTGAGTHPGAGLPGVLNSAKIVETLLTESLQPERQVA